MLRSYLYVKILCLPLIDEDGLIVPNHEWDKYTVEALPKCSDRFGYTTSCAFTYYQKVLSSLFKVRVKDCPTCLGIESRRVRSPTGAKKHDRNF